MAQTFYFLKLSSTTPIEEVLRFLESSAPDAPAEWKDTQQRITKALCAIEPGLDSMYDELDDNTAGIQIAFYLDGTASMTLYGWPLPEATLKRARAYADVFEDEGFTLCDCDNEILYKKGEELILIQPPAI
jgi:hypothetical protein